MDLLQTLTSFPPTQHFVDISYMVDIEDPT